MYQIVRGVDMFLNPGEASSYVAGIIYPLVEIGLNELPPPRNPRYNSITNRRKKL